MRIALAAVAGGIVVFIWSALAHMVLPLGEMGLSILPDEARVLSTLKTSVPEAGLYIFPALDPKTKHSEAVQKEWTERYQSGPAGILAYRPVGGTVFDPKQMISELLTNIVAALAVAFVVAMIAAPYLKRAGVAVLMAVFSIVSLTMSYHVWYGFPVTYVAGEAITEIVGWLLAGLVIAKIVRPPLTA